MTFEHLSYAFLSKTFINFTNFIKRTRANGPCPPPPGPRPPPASGPVAFQSYITGRLVVEVLKAAHSSTGFFSRGYITLSLHPLGISFHLFRVECGCGFMRFVVLHIKRDEVFSRNFGVSEKWGKLSKSTQAGSIGSGEDASGACNQCPKRCKQNTGKKRTGTQTRTEGNEWML